MAEDPSTWTDLEYAIQAALEDFDAGMADPDHYGLSRERVIADQLREGGFINEQNTGKLHATEGQADSHTRGCPCREARCPPLPTVQPD
jgi:hypothetical protein